MSDVLIASLQEQITRLQSENATIRAEAKARRLKGKTASDENESLRAQVAALTTQRDEFKAAASAAPSELQAKLDAARGQLRDRDHRDKFRSLATKSGVTQDKALDDLWSLSGYKAETDEVDDAKITAAITSALAGRDWLKSAAAPEGANGNGAAPHTKATETVSQVTRNPGPGASRGGTSGTSDPEAALAAAFPNAFRLA